MQSYQANTTPSSPNLAIKAPRTYPKLYLTRRKNLELMIKIAWYVNAFFTQERAYIEARIEMYKRGCFLERIDKRIKIDWTQDNPVPKLTPEQQELWEQRQRSKTGRRPFDTLLMLKIVFLGVLYRWSDRDTAFHVEDSATVKRFIGIDPKQNLKISRQVIWKYREIFVKTKLWESLFSWHQAHLRKHGLIGDGPLILDGSFVEAPKQRNTRAENQLIKEGKGQGLWYYHPHKRRHKEIDARWAKKNQETHYGYKIHALAEGTSKFIVYIRTTAASVHDSKVLDSILNDVEDAGKLFYADSAYSGANHIETIKSFGLIPEVCIHAQANKPLTERQKADNREKSRVRCRIEHIFGFIENSMGGSFVRCVGFLRANSYQWATALAYNLCREETLMYLKEVG